MSSFAYTNLDGMQMAMATTPCYMFGGESPRKMVRWFPTSLYRNFPAARATASFAGGDAPEDGDLLTLSGNPAEFNLLEAPINGVFVDGNFLTAYFPAPSGSTGTVLWQGFAMIRPGPIYEHVAIGQISRAVCLAPAVEQHGVRGFVTTVLWPPDTTEGEIAVQGADQNQHGAFDPLGVITYPTKQFTSPSGLVCTFMRLVVNVAPDSGTVAGRLMIR